MDSCRVACVRYLNTAPLVEGLDRVEGLRLVPTVPSRIAEMVAQGDADVGLASIVDATRPETPLEVLGAGMIGCDGPTLTVRLFSALPLERVQRVHADTDSHTSVILAKVLLARVFGANPEFVPFDARERVAVGGGAVPTPVLDESWPHTLLLIGDKVVNDSPPAVRYPYQLDLGEAWKRLTGLPFVYAAWMCRRGEGERPMIRTASRLLDRQRRHNATRLDWIVSTRAAPARWPADLARRYLGEFLRFELDDRARAGLTRFLDEAVTLGFLPGGEIRWAASTQLGVG